MRLTEQVDLDTAHLNWSGRACELVASCASGSGGSGTDVVSWAPIYVHIFPA